MPSPTYDLISEQVLSSAQSSVTFSSIPGTYKDLVLEAVQSQSGVYDTYIRVNGSNTGYSRTWLSGNGSTVSSGRNSNSGEYFVFYNGTTLSTGTVHFMSYANTSVFKTVLARNSAPGDASGAIAALWQNTAAITSMTIYGNTFASGSIFRLYGITG